MCLLTCHSKSLKLTNSVCIWQLLEDQCAEESETDKQYDTQCSSHVLHTEGALCWPTCKWIVTGVCWCCVSPLLGAPLGFSCHTRVCRVTSRGLKKCHHEWLPTSVQSL